MTSTVYYTDMTTKADRNLLEKTRKAAKKAGITACIEKNDLVAIKLHFGEPGNLAFTPPPLLRVITDMVRERGGKPFLTDANTLYRGKRRNAVDHIETAIKNGFTYETVGAPVIIADGLIGADYVNVEIGGKHFDTVKISSAVHQADSIIAVSHVKGHELFGFGGALKNLGMGCGSPSGKQTMHSDMVPKVDPEKCIACGTCIKYCPEDAISRVENNKAFINEELCIGCGECVAFCPVEAIPINWKTDEAAIQEKTAEYAYGVIKPKQGKTGFINYVMNVTPDCDCAPWNDIPIVSNLGILASTDPISVDQASLDIINQAPVISNSVLGKKNEPADADKFRAVHKKNTGYILDHGEFLGMGSRKHELKTFWMKQSKTVK